MHGKFILLYSMIILLWSTLAYSTSITYIITEEASKQHFDPKVALAVAKIESSLDPSAVGPMGEIGLFQIRPQFSPLSRTQLFDPKINAREGIRKLIEMRRLCPAKDGLTWVVCYNNGLRHPKYPKLYPYYRRFMVAYEP